MQIQINDEQKLLRDEVRRFAEEVAGPKAKEIDETGLFPRDTFAAAEVGLTGVSVPEQYGGAGINEQKRVFLTPVARARRSAASP